MKDVKRIEDKVLKVIPGLFSTVVSLLILIAIIFSMGNKVLIENDKIKIIGLSGIVINREEITNIELVEDMPNLGKRLKGISGGISGLYKLDNGEESYVYKKTKEGPNIKIICKSTNIYISFEENETKKIYYDLLKFLYE